MNPNLYFLLVILELLFVFGLASYTVGLLYSSIMGAPYVPTSKKIILDILKRAKLKKGQVFLELGSGDGRIVRKAVSLYQVAGIGVDINILLILFSRLLAKKDGLKNITFKRENIYKTDVSSCDVLYLFLMPDMLRKLLPRFQKELKKGTLVISHGFKLESLKDKLIDQMDVKPFPTYFYRV